MTRNKFNSPIMNYVTLGAFLKDNPKYKNIITVTPCNGDNGEEIDPWSENLTIDQRQHVNEACKNSIWYFFKYVVRIAGQPFGWNEPKVQFIWLYMHKQNAIWLSPRQLDGRSSMLYSLMLYSYLFGYENGKDHMLNAPNREQMTLHMNSISVPAWMFRKNKFVEFDDRVLPYNRRLQNFNVRFIDDLMYVTGCTFNNITSDYNSRMLIYGVGTLGLENADLIRHTLPFYTSMISSDEDQNMINIRNFSNTFCTFMGYKPIFLILSELDDHEVDPDFVEYAKAGMSGDFYRMQIACKPDWRI